METSIDQEQRKKESLVTRRIYYMHEFLELSLERRLYIAEVLVQLCELDIKSRDHINSLNLKKINTDAYDVEDQAVMSV